MSDRDEQNQKYFELLADKVGMHPQQLGLAVAWASQFGRLSYAYKCKLCGEALGKPHGKVAVLSTSDGFGSVHTTYGGCPRNPVARGDSGENVVTRNDLAEHVLRADERFGEVKL